MFLQILIILLAARVLAVVLRYLGQPPVIGEMAAGFVLGPMLFGWLMPDLQQQLFAPTNLHEVQGLGQLGLVLFMFLMGAELRIAEHGAGRHVRAAAQIAGLSLLLPMLLGVAIAPLLYPGMAPAGIAFWPFALFIGIALSVTALPVMARILKERKLAESEPGRLALSAAAIGDVVAWLMLAVVVAASKSDLNWTHLGLTLLGLTLLCGLVFGVVRPLVARYLQRGTAQGPLRVRDMGVLLSGALLCAYATELLQVHAAFGAFLFGLSLPRDERIADALQKRIEPLVLLVLMPCFFVLAGLNTTGNAFVVTGMSIFALILGVAIVGKIVAGSAAARIAGLPWRDSLMVGALMNTRGVVELVFLKVGLDAGLIGAELFTLLFMTALITTLMTTPLLSLISRVAPQR